MDYKKTGDFLKSLRKAKGFTQEQVAYKLMVTPKTISKWETGEGMPDINILPSIADFYGVTVDEILRGQKKLEDKEQKTIDKTEVNILTNKLNRKFDIYYYIAFGLFGLLYVMAVVFLFYNIYLSYFFMALAFIAPLVTLFLGIIDYKKNKSDDQTINEAILDYKNQIRKKIVILSIVFGLLLLIFLLVIFTHTISYDESMYNVYAKFFGSIYFYALFLFYCYLIYRNDNNKNKAQIINVLYITSVVTIILGSLLCSSIKFNRYTTPNSWITYSLTFFELLFHQRGNTTSDIKFNYFYTILSLIPLLVTIVLFILSFKFKALKNVTGFVALTTMSTVFIASLDIRFLDDLRRMDDGNLIDFRIYLAQLIIIVIALAFYIYYIVENHKINKTSKVSK